MPGHQWARELKNYGHEVKLIAPQFVAPYRRSGKAGKNDRNDAEAICEAVGRPAMRFVPIKDVEQQAVLMVHRARELLVSERTALVNQMRGLLGEYGLVLAQGVAQMRRAMLVIMDRAWGEVFRHILGKAERSLVKDLLAMRNRWAHQEPSSSDDAYRALDSAGRLLAAGTGAVFPTGGSRVAKLPALRPGRARGARVQEA